MSWFRRREPLRLPQDLVSSLVATSWPEAGAPEMETLIEVMRANAAGHHPMRVVPMPIRGATGGWCAPSEVIYDLHDQM